jgi:cytochrome P450
MVSYSIFDHRVNNLLVDPGDIVYVNVIGSNLVVVNSMEMASAMLDGKGSIYSERPYMHYVGTMVGFGEAMLLLNEGPHLKEQRRLFSQWLGNKTAFEQFVSIMETRIRRCIQQLLDKPSPAAIASLLRRCEKHT